MNATGMNDNGKDTKKNNIHGGKFTLSGLKESRQPAPVETPAHDELLQLVVEQAAPFDFVEYRYRKDVARDMKNNYIAELREKAKGGDGDAVKELEKLSKGITPKDYKVYVIEHFIETFKEYRFCSYNGLVYGYNGAYWQQVADSLFSQILGKIAEKYGVPGTTPRDEDFQTKLLRQFHAAADHPTPATNPLVNLKNGTLRIDQHGNAVLGAPKWREFVRYQLPYDYDPKATAPEFQAFLKEVLPERYLQHIIFEHLGLCFVPGMKAQHKILLFHGGGQNGKGVFSEVTEAAFGAVNVAHIGLDKLTQSGSTGEFAARGLDGKLLNFATELDSKSVKSDLFKQLASRETIRAALKGKDAFDLTPPPMISSCNELPRTGARDWGFYRRLQIIPFEATITAGTEITNLANKLIETELPGFLNLILAGLRRLIRNGGKYTANPKGDMLRDELWAESDSFTAFCEDCFAVEVEAPTQYGRAKIYGIFKQYCIENGRQIMSNRQFFGLLRQRKFQEIRGGDRPFVFPHPLTPEWADRYNFPQ